MTGRTAAGRLKLLGGCLLAAFLFAAIPTFSWWYIVQDNGQDVAAVVEIDIPPGTAEQVAAGAQPPTLPADIVLGPDSKLVIRNQDATTHRLGPISILPGTTTEVAAAVFASIDTSKFLCTFHPGGAIDLDVAARKSPMTALYTSLAVAFFLGGAAFGVISVTERLNL